MEENANANQRFEPVLPVTPGVPALPRVLSSQEEDFAVYLSGGVKFAEAAEQAGLPVEVASELVTEPIFKSRIDSLRTAYDRYIGVTKETHADKLAELRNQAVEFAMTNERQQGSLMNVALKAEQLRGELAGLYGIDTAGRVLGGVNVGAGGVTFNVNFVKPNVTEDAPRTIEGTVL